MKKALTVLVYLTLVYSSLFAQDVEIQGNAIITGTVEVMDTILFADGSQLASACLGLLQDADGDTKISVEQEADSDRIILTSNGTMVAIIDQDNFQIIHKGNSILIGELAGEKDDGNNGNLFIGNRAGSNNTSGAHNVYLGTEAGQLNNAGIENVHIGEKAGSQTTGANNVIIGGLAGFSTAGNQNVLLGHQAGETLNGNDNTILGASAGANASGSGNVILGKDAGKSLEGNNKLIIHNSPSLEPLISGEFDNLKLNLNADTKVEKVLSVQNEIQMLSLTEGGDNGIKFGFDGEANFGINTSHFRLPFSPFTSLFKKLDFGRYINGDLDEILTLTTTGRVGIGTAIPLNTVHVSSSSPVDHIMKIENTTPGIQGDGLEIKLNRPVNGSGNNFITFTSQNGVAGRIEGFNTEEDESFSAFPDIDFSNYFDLLQINNLAFHPGSLPTLSGGQLPSLSGGMFPSLNPGSLPILNPGTFPTFNPGQLPTLSGGSFGEYSINADFDADAFLRNLVCGPFCADPEEFYVFEPNISGASFPSLNSGQLPSLSGGQLPFLSGGQLPTLSGGSFPSINPGSIPILSGGQLPTFNIDVIFDPSPLSSAFDDLKLVMDWALEHGERSLLTTNPFDLSFITDFSFFEDLAGSKNGGVTYGSKGADYAEYLPRSERSEEIKSGQIVGVKGGMISKNTEEAEQLLVISMMPVILGNMPENPDSLTNYEKVAFLGQAPVWVVGEVASGDYIIPSGNNDGYGIALNPEKVTLEHLSKIVGRAWSEGSKSVNLVNMAIGLKTNELSSILLKQDKRMTNFEERLASLEGALPLK